eukprot:TRINITY_DN61736_c0_g1_i1.p2 TRINITY_DN61736_c0_g1~~TRINITY_DN61736_c0_g1_i1.p2  ORF type:complete len:358 (+),score=57.33 TRINITY_DN61736_c0_g1_i1:59-1132(+)
MPTLSLFALMWCCVVVFGDYYQDLELAKGEDSSDSEIKKAWRTLSKKYHPDLNKSPEAKPRYEKIAKAYDVLSDRRKRKIYDMKGDDGLKMLEEQEKNQHQHDPFAALFGHSRDRTKGNDVNMNLKVSLDDIYNGNTHTVTLQKQKLCRSCKGSGARSPSDIGQCNRCQGKGVMIQKVQLAPGFVQQIQQPCGECDGTGKKIKKKCPTCKGQKVTRGESNLEVMIEKGIPEGFEMKFEMEADESPDILPGDVIFKIHSQPHHTFKRSDNDLHMTMKITLLEALVGFTKTVEHMDGHQVEVSRTAVTPHGFKKTIRGEGMPIHNVPSETGNLIVTFEVTFPKVVTPQQAEEFKKLLVK